MTHAIVEAKDINVRFSQRPILNDVSARVRAGEILVVAGPNGAGKSTLLRVLAGLLQPERGSVRVEGAALAGLDRRAAGRAIAYLPQDRIVHWPMTAQTVVGLGRLPHREPYAAESAADHQAIANAMAAMDVAHLAHRSIAELSGGERARVLVARALAQGARVLIADEPTAGLDPAHALALCSHLRRLAGEGRAIVVALHDLSVVARYADKVILLKDGRVAARGPVRDVLTEDILAAVYGARIVIGDVAGVPVVLAHSSLT